MFPHFGCKSIFDFTGHPALIIGIIFLGTYVRENKIKYPDVSQRNDYLTFLSVAGDEQKANMLFGLSQIKAFENSPNQFETVPAVAMPPGAPIMPDLYFLGD